MKGELTKERVAGMVEETVGSLPRDECRTCDCFQGFLTQLELDADEDVSAIMAPLKVGREEMHGCLGCEPCPPGAAFAQYLKGNRGGCCGG